MIDYTFWNKWADKTQLEQRAIEAVIKARELVIDSVPTRALVAIYIKGSFARREMTESSDVDMVPIVTENKYQGAIFGVNCPEIEPVCVVPLSLSELRKNKLASKGSYTPDLRAEPDLFLLKLNHYQLIYGTALSPADFPQDQKLKFYMMKLIKYETATLKPIKKELYHLSHY